jgi:hypothetical protein
MSPVPEKVGVVNVFNTIGKMANYPVVYFRRMLKELMIVPSRILSDAKRND